MSYRDKTCRGFIETGIALQLLGGVIAVVVASNLRQLQMGLVMYLLIYCQLI